MTETGPCFAPLAWTGIHDISSSAKTESFWRNSKDGTRTAKLPSATPSHARSYSNDRARLHNVFFNPVTMKNSRVSSHFQSISDWNVCSLLLLPSTPARAVDLYQRLKLS